MEFISGRELNGYKLVERLGAGGMGTVYRAYHESMKREVAIKFLLLDYADDPQYIVRFNREAETLVQLEHPHIVPIYDYGMYQNSSYIVMRLLVGGSLHRLLRRGQVLTLPQVTRIFQQVTSALHYAHQQGIIHRDIKANNVMLDNVGNAYLTDFGIAKLVYETGQFTSTGTTLGTPMYMAPELWQGEASSIKADIYALGILLYQMLAGELPFTASTPFALMAKHLNEMPRPVSVQRQDIDDAVDAIISQALAKSPEERFADARIFYENFASVTLGMNITVSHAKSFTPNNGADNTLDSSRTPQLNEEKFTTKIITDKPNIANPSQQQTIIMESSNTESPTGRRQTLLFILLALIIILGGLWVLSGFGDDEEPNDIVLQNTASPTRNSSTEIPTVVETVLTPLGVLYDTNGPRPYYADEMVNPTQDSVLVFMLEDDLLAEILLRANSEVIFHYDADTPQVNIEFMDDSLIFVATSNEAASQIQFVYQHEDDTLPLSFGEACSATEYMTDVDTLTSILTTYCLSQDVTCSINDTLALEFGEFVRWDLASDPLESTRGDSPEFSENIVALYKRFDVNYELPECLLSLVEGTATITPSSIEASPTNTSRPVSTPTRLLPTSTNTLHSPTHTFVPSTNTLRPPATSTPVPPTSIIPTVDVIPTVGFIPTVNILPTTDGYLSSDSSSPQK